MERIRNKLLEIDPAMSFGFGKGQVQLSTGKPFNWLTELLGPGTHDAYDKVFITLTFERAEKAKKFYEKAKAAGLVCSPHYRIKKRGLDWVRTKTFREVTVRV
jgi:hypothetical protein